VAVIRRAGGGQGVAGQVEARRLSRVRVAMGDVGG